MTEDSINRIINSAFSAIMLGMLVYFMLSLRKSNIALENKPKATANQKSIWDKLLIVSKLMGTLGVLIFSIVKLIQLFK